MSLDAQFLDLAPHTVTVAPFSTVDADHTVVYSTATTSYSALVVEEARTVANADGEEIVSRTHVYLFSTSADVGARDQVTLPDGSTPDLLRIERNADADGTHHSVLYFG